MADEELDLESLLRDAYGASGAPDAAGFPSFDAMPGPVDFLRRNYFTEEELAGLGPLAAFRDRLRESLAALGLEAAARAPDNMDFLSYRRSLPADSVLVEARVGPLAPLYLGLGRELADELERGALRLRIAGERGLGGAFARLFGPALAALAPPSAPEIVGVLGPSRVEPPRDNSYVMAVHDVAAAGRPLPPLQLLAPAWELRRLAEGAPGIPAGGPEDDGRARVAVGRGSLSRSAFASLGPGDWLALPAPDLSPAYLVAGGLALAACEVMKASGRYGARVLEPLAEPFPYPGPGGAGELRFALSVGRVAEGGPGPGGLEAGASLDLDARLYDFCELRFSNGARAWGRLLCGEEEAGVLLFGSETGRS